MKKHLSNGILIIAIGGVATGCANLSGIATSVATREVAVATVIKQGDLIEDAITAGREVDFPPATKIDKEAGIVEFGHFEGSQMGITAQLRVKSPTEVEITVKRLTPFVKVPADAPADEFMTKLKAQLSDVAPKATP